MFCVCKEGFVNQDSKKSNYFGFHQLSFLILQKKVFSV
nr:MAG TPA: Thermolysin [Bacteriophage sp.]